MRVINVDTVAGTGRPALESFLRLRKAEMVSKGQLVKKNASTVPSRPSRKNPVVEDGGAADPTPAPRKKWTTKLVHPQYQIVGDECPKCAFPEAEGGYCPECGWSLPHPFKK